MSVVRVMVCMGHLCLSNSQPNITPQNSQESEPAICKRSMMICTSIPLPQPHRPRADVLLAAVFDYLAGAGGDERDDRHDDYVCRCAAEKDDGTDAGRTKHEGQDTFHLNPTGQPVTK